MVSQNVKATAVGNVSPLLFQTAKQKLQSIANPPYLYKLSEHHWDMWSFPSGHISPQTAQFRFVPFLLWLLEVPGYQAYLQLPDLL